MGVKVRKLQCPCEKFELGLKLPIFSPGVVTLSLKMCIFHSKMVFNLPTVVFVSHLEKVCTSKGDDVQSDFLTSYQLQEPAQ